MSSVKVLLGVLAGAAAGSTLGILFAPEKVSGTHLRISKKADDYLDNLKGKFDDFLLTATNELDYVKKRSRKFS